MDSKAPGWIRAVPNALSGLRLALAAAFPFVPPAVRLPVVVASGATDWLDGWIARRFHVQSTVGGLLDAVADKTFVLSALLTLASAGLLAWWQVPLLLVRDAAVLFTALFFARRREWAAFRGMPARWSGKITTALTFAFFVVALVPALADLRFPLFLSTASASLLAGADYMAYFVRALATRTER
jgi:phosphatidylglycerophosphate synthase